jgi:phosphoenolpyruvate synthase/pyruvate phosphate dikinase
VTSELADKPRKLVQCAEGGVKGVAVEEEAQKVAVLSTENAAAIARLLVHLEEELGRPQDFEWAMEGGKFLETST